MPKTGSKTLGKSKAKFKATKELLYLIELAKELPRDPVTSADIRAEVGGNWNKQMRYLIDYLKNAPGCLAFVHGQSDFFSDNIPDVPRHYENLRNSVEKMRLIASQQLNTTKTKAGKTIQSGFSPLIREQLNAALYFDIDADGRMFFKETEFFKRAVEGNLVNRIRECEVCGNVFYAQRDDKRGCSDRCSNTLRQRRIYELSKEKGQQYLEARKKAKSKVKRKNK
jgi:hypothetical protein